jgi:hypothetical protein
VEPNSILHVEEGRQVFFKRHKIFRDNKERLRLPHLAILS